MSSSRRHFLRSALVLPSALAASALAQDKKDTPLVPFADFENGWDDWTVEGLAFDTRPATDALFPGKISGFGGRGFVCTLHPRKGNAATGKAVSREFVIDKPFITFKIGGGNFPHRESGGQACLNLVVDNKIERTATGDGTANLSEKSWDVSALVGKKARLEIIDNTVSDQRGYILVDDIGFAQGDTASVTGGFLKVPNIKSYRFYSQSILANKNIAYAFGTSDKALDRIEYDIWQRCVAPDLQYNPGESLRQLAERLKTATLSVRGVDKDKPVFEYACAYMITSWVKSHMRYVDMGEGISHTGSDTQGNKVEFEKRYTWISIPKMLQCTALEGACRHSAVLIRSIATHTGLKCWYASGTLRTTSLRAMRQGIDIRALPNHAWNVFEFSNGMVLPTDGTGTSTLQSDWINLCKRYYPTSVTEVFPREPLPLDWFLSRHYANGLNDTGFSVESVDGLATHPKNDRKSVREHQDKSQKPSFDEWIAMDNRYLDNAIRDLTRSRAVK